MALYKNGAFVADAWRFPRRGRARGRRRAVVVGKARFLAERDALVGRNADLGLVLQSGEELDGLEQDLHRFRLIVLTIPRYTDGRSYSVASLLRERHGYTGELRATGDVLRDQIPLMLRCGFDAFDVTNEPTRRALEQGKVHGVTAHYQPAAPTPARACPRARAPGCASPRGDLRIRPCPVVRCFAGGAASSPRAAPAVAASRQPRGGVDPHHARGGGRVRQPGDAVLHRQGLAR